MIKPLNSVEESILLVRVEITSGDLLPYHIMVDVETLGQMEIAVEYAWKHVMCSLCKGFGHFANSCRAVKEEWRPKMPATAQSSDECWKIQARGCLS